jgi:hypothetical protein
MNKVQAPQGYELFGNPYFNEGVAVVKKDSKYGLMDLKTNKIVLPCNFKSVFCVAKQKALVLTDKGGAIIDLQTQKSVWEKEGGFMDFRRNVKLFDEVLLVAIPSAKHQLIKPENGQVIGEYAEISLYPLRSPTDKMLISAKNTAGKWGVIDTQNKVVIPFDYDEFYGGLVGGSWEDKNDKGELLKVKKGSFWGAIDYTNKTVIPFEYEDINYVGELGVIFVGKGGKKGVLSKRNEVLVPVKYDEIAAVYYQKIDGEIKGFSLPSGILQVEVGKKVGLYSTTLKKELVAPQYREFQNITPNSAECVGFDGKITKIQF